MTEPRSPWVAVGVLIASVLATVLAAPAATASTVTIVIDAPADGDAWSAGSVHEVRYYLHSDSGNGALAARITYASDTGSGVVADPAPGLNNGPGARNHYNWTLPAQDLANVTITVCAHDPTEPDTCGTSAVFRIDGTPPAVVSHAPTGGNVPLDAPLQVSFSEWIYFKFKAPASVTLSPDPGGLTYADAPPNGWTVGHNPLAPGTTYRATVGCAATDESDPGNPLVGCPFSWTFTTDYRPSVALARPAGGEVWSGGSTHTVAWTASDREDPVAALQVYVDGSLDDGATWSPLAGPLAGDASYPWTVPFADTATARVRARVVDTLGLAATSVSAAFAIDGTPPRVSGTSPANAEPGVGWTANVVADFSEPVLGAADRGTLSVRTLAGAWVPGVVTRDSPTRIRFAPAGQYAASTLYVARVNATLRDASDPGNLLAPLAWSFVTASNHAPAVALTFAADPVLSGGSTWPVSWSATDPDDAPALLRVSIAFFDGTDFVPVGSDLPASGTVPWRLPATNDVAAAALVVRVVDSQGAEATDSVTFAIDATPPTVAARSPAPGTTEVPPNSTVQVTFSEPVDPATVSVGLRENATGAWVDVAVAWDDPVTLRMTPAVLLRERATYVVVVNGTARDLSSPGNALAAASWSFRIASFPPIVAVTEPAPGARWSAGSSQTVRVAAADAQDPTVSVRIDLALDGAAFAPLAAGPMANGEAAFSVRLPAADAPAAVLRACATDGAGATACASVPVVVDGARPRLLSVSPAADARRVNPDAPLVLVFSESMDAATVEGALTIEPAAALSFSWSRTAADNDTVVVTHPRLAELRHYAATLRCGAHDGSAPGLPLEGLCPFSWTFRTAAAPTVRLLHPTGGERLTGGAGLTLRVLAADEDPAVRATVDLSVDGGATFPTTLLADALLPVGGADLPVVLPRLDAPAAVVRVTVRNSVDFTAAAASAPFAIDGTPPRILSASPAPGSDDVLPGATFVIVFSESMDPASLEAALTVTPPLGNPGYPWTTTNVPVDTLAIPHDAPPWGTAVRIAFDGLRDASRPGNAMAATIAFSIQPDAERPIPRLAFSSEADQGEVVVLDATASTDNDAIASYAWTIRDADGQLYARLHGERAEWRASDAGTYDVTLEVADPSGNAATASAPLRVQALATDAGAVLPGVTVTTISWLALLGAGGSGAYGYTDRGRSFLSRAILAPLYVKVRGPAVLDSKVRGMIRGYVQANPGDCFSDLKRNLGLANGEAAYHLSVLEREGYVKSTTRGMKRLYYPAEMSIPENGHGLHAVQAGILVHASEAPGLTITELSNALGMSRQAVWYHLRRLAQMRLVRMERMGMVVRLYATGAAPERSAPLVAAPAQIAAALGGNGGGNGGLVGVEERPRDTSE